MELFQDYTSEKLRGKQIQTFFMAYLTNAFPC